MQRERDEMVDGPYRRDFLTYDNHILDGDIFLQALNGFLMILDCNGELFFATHTIETYLGFHQVLIIFLNYQIYTSYLRFHQVFSKLDYVNSEWYIFYTMFELNPPN